MKVHTILVCTLYSIKYGIMTNTLAYDIMAIHAIVKRLIVWFPGSLIFPYKYGGTKGF
jgi:hypothetical protein